MVPGGNLFRGPVDEFYVLRHDEAGPIATFLTRGEVISAIGEVVRDEPDWRGELSVERFSLVVTEASRQ